GMGENTLRALASDLAYLAAWAKAATGDSLPWPVPEALALKFVASRITFGISASASARAANRAVLAFMWGMLKLIWCIVIGLFRSRVALKAEILILRHQLIAWLGKNASRKRLIERSGDVVVRPSLAAYIIGTLDSEFR